MDKFGASYICCLVCCAILITVTDTASILTDDSSLSDVDNSDAQLINSALKDPSIAIIPALPKRKLGRKDRCRNVVRREVAKYAARVQALADKVMFLQEEVNSMRQQQDTQGLQAEEMRGNLTEQRQLLTRTLQQVENLQSHMTTLTGIGSIHEGSAPETEINDQPGIPRDCDDIYKRGGMRFAGTYQMTIQPRENHSSFEVLCEPLNDAGWVVIQNRYDGSEEFRREWHEYKKGFGKLQSEFWLGNEYIHRITSAGPTTLRIELEEFSGRKHWAEYSDFSIENESSNYRLHISGYSGNAGDSIRSLNGSEFSTHDEDNDRSMFDNCAQTFGSGWWFGSSCQSNLNGAYLDRESHNNIFSNDGIIWPQIHTHKSLKSARMLIKPAATAAD